MKKKLFVIDAYAHIFRAFYGIKHITNNAVYGFIRILMKVQKDFRPDYIVAVFDAGGPTFRHQMYEEYKANRAKMPDDLAVQIPLIKKGVEAMNIVQVEQQGLEADDIIADLVHEGIKNDLEVVIVSSDKDLLQLVGNGAVMMDPKKDYSVMDSRGVEEFFGVHPSKVADVLALMGDSSDNVPGAKGIGEKTAKSLIQEFGSLDAIYESIESIKGKKKEKLLDSREDVIMSKKLVTLSPGEFECGSLEQYKAKEPEMDQWIEFLNEAGFNSILKEMGQDSVEEENRNYTLIDTEQAFYGFLNTLKKQKFFSFDFETCDLDTIMPRVAGIAFSFKAGEGYYLALISRNKEKLDSRQVFSLLKPFFEEKNIQKTGHNLKYEYSVLRSLGIQLRGIHNDSMVQSYLLDSDFRHHSIDELSRKHLNLTTTSYKELTGGLSICDIPCENVSDYACEDADMSLRLAEKFSKTIKKESLVQVYEDIERPLIPVLSDIERNGVLLDTALLKRLSADYELKCRAHESKVFELAGCEFNMNSPKQLGHVLFEKQGLPVLKKTRKTKSYSTGHDILVELSKNYEIADQILQYRKYAKLKSTYVDALPEMVHKQTGRIHTSYNQTVAATGRLSSSDPNLQNIPVKTADGREIRKAFVAPEGRVLLVADYSQIELRVLAHLSEDTILIDAFKNNEDIHRRTAAEIFGVESDNVTDDMRNRAKTVNFGVVYGKREFSLSQELGITMGEAREFIDHYFERMPSVKKYIEGIIETVHREKQVSTLFGRKRKLPEIASNNGNVRKSAERMAVNMPVQGTAADIIKLAMIRISEKLKQSELNGLMIMQVHDELVFEVDREHAQALKDLVIYEMEHVVDLAVPLKVNAGLGENWEEAK